MTQEQIDQILKDAGAARAESIRLRDALAFSEVEVSLERSWCRLCRTEGRGEARGRYSHPHALSCLLRDPPAPPIPVREACRRRMPLSGADAQALEGALAMTERERDTLSYALQDIAEGDCEYSDNCPSNAGTRHGVCVSCKARKALQEAGIPLRYAGDE